jgi:hypothetical protein
MKRRKFILSGGVGLLGASLPRGAAGQALPCPPPLVKAAGGAQAATSCEQPAPTWLQNISVFQWVQIPGTVLSSSGAVANVPTQGGSPGVYGSAWNGQVNGVERYAVVAYTGGCINSTTSSLIVHGGGHVDYPGNEVYELKLSDAAPAWVQWFPPSQALANTTAYGFTIARGSGYTPASGTTTYNNVALKGGSGTGATANITVVNGAVSTVLTNTPGTGYASGDVLTTANTSIGGTGSGFQLTLNNGAAYNLDGTPAAAHTNYQIQFSTPNNKLYRFGASAVWGNGNGNYPTVDSCSYRATRWDAAGTNANLPVTPAEGIDSVWQDAAGNVWIQTINGQLMKWSPLKPTAAANVVATLAAQAGEQCSACDTFRNRVLRVSNYSGATPWGLLSLSDLAAGYVKITMSPTIPVSAAGPEGNIVYDPINDCFWYAPCQQGSSTITVYKIKAGQTGTSWTSSTASFTGAIPDCSDTSGYGIFYGRFNYVPALRGLVYMENARQNVYFVRTA